MDFSFFPVDSSINCITPIDQQPIKLLGKLSITKSGNTDKFVDRDTDNGGYEEPSKRPKIDLDSGSPIYPVS